MKAMVTIDGFPVMSVIVESLLGDHRRFKSSFDSTCWRVWVSTSLGKVGISLGSGRMAMTLDMVTVQRVDEFRSDAEVLDPR